MGCRPIAPITPFEKWTTADQQAWRGRPTAWSREYSGEIAREYGRLLAWRVSSDCPRGAAQRETLFAYANWLKQVGSEQHGLNRLHLLILALLVVDPNGEVRRLQQALSVWQDDYATRHRGRPARRGNRHPREPGYTLRPRDWPDKVRACWEAMTAVGGKYVGGGTLSGYRPSTLSSYQQAYCLWLGFLQRSGQDLEAAPSANLVEAFVGELELRLRPKTAATTLRRTRRVLAALDQRFDGAPFEYHQRRLSGREDGETSKLPRLVHPALLVAAGEKLISGARRRLQDRRAALEYRDGLLLILLAHRPARIGNVSAIRLGAELQLDGPIGRLSWTPAQTKNKIALSLSLNAELVSLVREYLETFQPLLARDASAHLWLGWYGAPLTTRGLQQIIARRTEKLLGKRVPPHLFRDCLATMIATERPENIDDVQAILGHAAPHSKDTYIALARSIVTQRRRDALGLNARKANGRPQLRFRFS